MLVPVVMYVWRGLKCLLLLLLLQGPAPLTLGHHRPSLPLIVNPLSCSPACLVLPPTLWQAAENVRALMDSLPPMRPLVMVLKVFLQQRELNEVSRQGFPTSGEVNA